MKKAVFLFCLLLTGCAEDNPSGRPVRSPYNQMKLVTVEGDGSDEWEIWEDTVTKTRILCHHSGFSGSYGGRSTSCVVVGEAR